MTPHAPAGRRLRPSDCRNVREMAQEYRLISQKQGRWSCTPRRTRKPDFSRLASSNQALPRHPGVSPYRCCLPALAGFEGSCRAGPDLQHHLAEADSNPRALRWGIRPRVERISGAAKAAKAPLAPHLARPRGNHTRTTQKRKWLGGRPPTWPPGVSHLSAERAGFEPALDFSKHALQACALDRTTLPLQSPVQGYRLRCGLYHKNAAHWCRSRFERGPQV